MSLEKEPAGTFNKAQRLIEYSLHIDPCELLQGAKAINRASTIRGLDLSINTMHCGI